MLTYITTFRVLGIIFGIIHHLLILVLSRFKAFSTHLNIKVCFVPVKTETEATHIL